MTLKKRLFRWMKILVIIYCIIGIGLYYLQDKILFHPKVLPADYRMSFDFPFKEVNIPYSANSVMNIIQFTTVDTAVKGVILYFHGNKENTIRYAPAAPSFTKYGWEVWMLDYPGFGKSTGQLTEETLYKWSLTYYQLARARFEPSKIIIYGRSMGSGIAAQLASVRDCRYLILESAYYSFPSIFNTYFPIYPYRKMIHFEFPTYKYLKAVHAPIICFHGTADEIIPYRNGEKLIPILKENDEFVTIRSATHNDLGTFEVYTRKIDSLLK